MGNRRKNRSSPYSNFLRLVLVALFVVLIYVRRAEIGMLLVNWNNETSKTDVSDIPDSAKEKINNELSTASSIDASKLSSELNLADAPVYSDSRVPNPEKIVSCYKNVVERNYSWQSHDYIYSFSIDFNVYESLYKYYKSLGRYYDTDMIKYIEDPTNLKIVDQLVDSIKRLCASSGYSEDATVREAINFVQNLNYLEDEGDKIINEWPKYPIETLYDYGGDCEDHTILLGAMLKEMGYGCAFILFNDHVGIGIAGSDDMPGAYYQYGGVNYYFVETTYPEWKIGEVPDDYKDKEARIIVIN